MADGDDSSSRPAPPTCRLVALDGNGTLLRADGLGVGERTRRALERVQDMGIPCVMVTGRGLEKARPTLSQAGLRQYVITENGARAMRIEDGMALYELWLEAAEAAAPVSRIREQLPGTSFAQLTADGGVIEASHPWLRRGGEDEEVARRLFQHIAPGSLEEALLEDGEAAGPRRCAKCYATAEVAPGGNFAEAMSEVQRAAGDGWEVRQIKQLLPGGVENTCEVQSTRVNKADGLAALCAAIGVSMENVWAFGDDVNDARMLAEVGWGVRMANHTRGLDGVGNDVTKFGNDEDGVAAYLEEHLLGAAPA